MTETFVMQDKHPHPGQQFSTYLPDNTEGRRVLKLLQKTFEQQLLFTVVARGDGLDVITPSIPLKTAVEGGGTE